MPLMDRGQSIRSSPWVSMIKAGRVYVLHGLPATNPTIPGMKFSLAAKIKLGFSSVSNTKRILSASAFFADSLVKVCRLTFQFIQNFA